MKFINRNFYLRKLINVMDTPNRILIIILCGIIISGTITLDFKKSQKEKLNIHNEDNNLIGNNTSTSSLLNKEKIEIIQIFSSKDRSEYQNKITDLNKKNKIINLLKEKTVPIDNNINFAGTTETDNSPTYEIKLFDKTGTEISTYIIKEGVLKNNSNNKYFIFESISNYEDLLTLII